MHELGQRHDLFGSKQEILDLRVRVIKVSIFGFKFKVLNDYIISRIPTYINVVNWLLI